ncbi:MAG: ATP synthase F1 subunit delta [Bacteroidetes bacterium]|jgi:F-type H+-transporting ATPase subunit delta|nr:ATP synthase F1 subunit delta [Bacteroidota bacterium]
MESKVAGRYAKSLLGLAIEQKTEEKVFGDMQLITSTVGASRELALLLRNPIVNTDKKLNIASALFKGKVSDLTLAFLNIIISKKRELYLEDISRQFISMYKAYVGIETAYVTTPFALDEKLRAEIMKIVSAAAKGKVELVEQIDKDLIGGFVLKMNNRQVDTSIESKLREIRRELKINLYEKNY